MAQYMLLSLFMLVMHVCIVFTIFMKPVDCVHECVLEYVRVNLKVVSYLLSLHYYLSIINHYIRTFYNRKNTMFKKRTTQNKTQSIQTLLTQITTQPNENVHNTGSIDHNNNDGDGEEFRFRNKKQSKVNVYQIGANRKQMFANINNSQQNINPKRQHSQPISVQPVYQPQPNPNPTSQLQQIQQCFAQFLNSQKQQLNTDNNQQYDNEPTNKYKYVDEDIQPYHHPTTVINQHAMQEQAYDDDGEKEMPVLYEVVVEDQSGVIEVREDFGDIQGSDSSDNSEEFKDSIENRMIRQALTKSNYDQLKSKISPSVHVPQKNKMIKKLQKISRVSVQRRMLRDLQAKKIRKNQLITAIRTIQTKIKTRNNETSTIKQDKHNIQNQLKKVQNMISMLFYFGSQLQTKGLKVEKLAQLTQQQEWADKLQKVRQKICKNRKQYERKKKQEKGEEEEDKQGSDVELIGKDKYQGNWEGEEMDDEEQAQRQEKQGKILFKNKNSKNRTTSRNTSINREDKQIYISDGEEDDDQYMEIDDD